MMRQIRHPLVRRDVAGIFDHVLETTGGDLAAAEWRLDEIDALLEAIADNPGSGIRLDGRLAGWLARHRGRGSDHHCVPRQQRGASSI
jgi:plasmid stabilization system protein ParE